MPKHNSTTHAIYDLRRLALLVSACGGEQQCGAVHRKPNEGIKKIKIKEKK
jgi:hypothetical protein